MARTVSALHADWLALVEPSGAFLTLPVLKRAFPNGLPPADRGLRVEVRARLESLGRDPAARTAWLQFLLREVLGLDPRLREGAGVPPGLLHVVSEHGTTLRPDLAVVEEHDEHARARLLVCRWPLGTPLDQRPARDEHGRATRWAATPIDRAATLCRAAGVPLALVTDTDRLALVWAPRGAPGGHATWVSSLFGEERVLLDAFAAVLGLHRFFGVAEGDTLEALLRESAGAQHEVTTQLGAQVRQAVELLVGAFSRAHRASGLQALAGIAPGEVYHAAVTVMMRLVVLLAAEERRLLPADDVVWAEGYSVLTLREAIEAQAARDGVETLEKRQSAWHRLLATFRAVHGGLSHDRLNLPAYGGRLFDPDRFPFLERPVPVAVDDRTTLAVLDALQVLTFRQGGVTEARRLSYRNLDVEQIGHVYEGLLDHGCRVASGIVVGLAGRKGEEPEEALIDVEEALARGDETFGAWLEERGGPSAARCAQLLDEQLAPDAEHHLLAACDNDEGVFRRVRRVAGLLRRDLRGLPMVFLPGSLYVTQTSARRDTGTAYTTKELADEVVRYALEPLVYEPGPAEGAAPEQWKLKPARELLALKVCDPAVGSGAILVAACRYLADRLAEAWDGGRGFSPAVPATSPAAEDLVLLARRAITDHCLYGVDRNPMAVEMAKLSLWLTTLAKERPFTFLDHQLRAGDSLLGVTGLDQVRAFHLDPARGRALHGASLFDPTKAIDPLVDRALATARELMAIDVVTLRDVEEKARLHARMVEALAPLSVVADTIVGSALATAGRPAKELDAALAARAEEVHRALDPEAAPESRERALADLRDRAAFDLDTGRPDGSPERTCLHWPLAFPEVFLRGPASPQAGAAPQAGFDAVIGNPPFLGGQRITGALGVPYRNHCVEHIAGGARGSADLVAYFFLRAFSLLAEPGQFGLLATNTIAQGDTREVGLEQLVARGAAIIRGVPSEPWPGAAALEIAKVWVRKGAWNGETVLAGQPVASISPFLALPGRVTGTPYRLKANENKSFQGSIVLGMGFVMAPEEAEALVAKDARNRDVLFPYLNGEDLNSRWDQSPSRRVINFRDWPLDREAEGSWAGASEAQRKKWLQAGSVPRDYPERVAADYPDCLAIVRQKVKPERDRNKRKVRRERWWQFAERAPELYATIAGMERVLVVSLVTHHVCLGLVPASYVFAHRLALFPLPAMSQFAVMQSWLHEIWAREYSSQLETRLNYSPSDCFETFARPAFMDRLEARGLRLEAEQGREARGLRPEAEPGPEARGSRLEAESGLRLAAEGRLAATSDDERHRAALEDIGRRYYEHRQAIMTARREGLTKTYNRFHDPREAAADIVRLRELHVEMDRAVAAAYGWTDLDLGHGFHDTKQGLRYTVSSTARQEILDRLLELNHARYAEEVAAGLHGKTGIRGQGSGVSKRRSARKARAKSRSAAPGGLFEE